MSDGDKVHQQRGKLVTNGHFRVCWLSALDVQSQIMPLNWTFATHSWEETVDRDLQHTNLDVWQVCLLEATFYPTPVHKEAKPVVKSIKTCTPEKWKDLNINERWWEVLDLCVQSVFPPSSSFKEGIFFLFNKHSFRLWQHLKKTRICFQSKVRCCSPTRCFILYGVSVILSTLGQGLSLDERWWFWI